MPNRRVLTDAQAAEVVRRYVEGETIDELAAAFGVSIRPIRSRIETAGVAFRSRGHKAPDLDADEVAAAYAETGSVLECARRFDVSRTMIRRVLRDAGVAIDPTPGPRS